jgi:hypothetical protein
MFEDGSVQTQELSLGPASRATVRVNGVVEPGKDFSTFVASDKPIVAERPMYFNYQGKWTGGHDVVGAPRPASAYYFSEGCTASGFDEWLCIMNPSGQDTVAHITYICADGSWQEHDVAVGASSRSTIYVNRDVGWGKGVSTIIRADSPIVAERPMYFNYGWRWTGGHNAIGYCP